MSSSLLWDGTTLPVQARQLIEIGEACVLHPYLDGTGVPTIGWGSITMPDGARVTMQSRALTQAEADALLDQQLAAEVRAWRARSRWRSRRALLRRWWIFRTISACMRWPAARCGR